MGSKKQRLQNISEIRYYLRQHSFFKEVMTDNYNQFVISLKPERTNGSVS